MKLLAFSGLRTTYRALITLLFVVAGGLTAMSATAAATDSIVGMRVDDFELVDQNGIAHRLYYYQNAPAVVLMSQGNGCPIVRNAMPGLREVRDAYADKGVEFFLLNSNIQDNRASIAGEVEEFGFDIRVLVDENQLVGESLNITRTAEIFVIDPKTKKVVYHGPIDDRLTYENQKSSAKHTYLADALDAVISGDKVEVAQVDAPGCLVNFPERAMKQQHASISYSKTIAPILEAKCVGCHQKGAIGPWAMSSYNMVKGFAPMIREVIRTDRMPPWHADPNVGHFLREQSLSGDQIKTLVHWIEAGAPRGEGADPLTVPREPIKEWPLGEPDLIVKLPAFEVPATGVVDYQYPVVDNPITEGKWLRASTVKVGARKAVHHLLNGIMKEKPADGERGQSRWGPSIGGYAVGAESQIARGNSGTFLPAGGYIGFQMHYTPFGKAVTDESEVGLYFYDDDKKPDLVTRSSVVIDVSLVIPPGEGRHEERAYREFPKDAILLSVFPHAHYRGQSSKMVLRYPDGSEKLIASLPRYDFNWQRSYEFVEPIDVPAGSKLIAINTYDNSTSNPANPDPTAEVLWGQQSHEEMLFNAFTFRWKDETSDNLKPEYEKLMREGMVFGMMDDNINGILEKKELRGIAGKRLLASFDGLDKNGDGALSKEELEMLNRLMARN